MKVLHHLLAATLALVIPTLTAAAEGPQALNERPSANSARSRVGGDAAAMTVDAIAVPADTPIVVDGRFNEEIWQQAPVDRDG